MAFAKARTALAQVEEKLRRQFGLAGEVGASLQPVITPVIITGDLRDAGNASNQGRAFAFSYAGPIGAGIGGPYWSLRTEADIFVDRITLTLSAAGLCRCYLLTPGVTPAVAVATLAGTWVDRKTIAGDQVPLTRGVPGALTGTAETDQTTFLSVLCAASGAYVPVDVNMMLPAGSTINLQVTAATVFNMSGRIWP